MEFSKRIRKNGMLYRHRDKLQKTNENLANIVVSSSTTSRNSPDQIVSENRQSEDCPDGTFTLLDCGGLESDDHDCSSSEDSDVIDVDETEDGNEENSSIFKHMSFIDSVRYWALATNQTHHAVRMKLEILRAHTPHAFPKDARTLLKTPRAVTNIKNIEGGKYWYYGLQQCIMKNFSDEEIDVENISINISIDGLPLHKSSSTQFWPILANIHELPAFPVMTVAIFCGSKKPGNLDEFLEPLVTELNFLMETGVHVRSRKIGVKLRAIIADSPARAFIKGVAYFNAKNGCLKCKCVGEFNYDSNTVVFRGIKAPLRTDQEFRRVIETAHHKVLTPLLLLNNFNMIEDVTVADPLHLIYLGMMRRLLFGWRDGTLGKYTKWDGNTVDKISNWLENLKLPHEFHRKTRDLYCLRHWKGTEFSTFFHYLSFVILKNFLPEDAYEHFMLLFSSITLLSSKTYKNNWELAAEMLEQYILDFEKIYGVKYMTSNVHNLQHIYNDVKKFGPMLSISTFPFENELQSIKHMLRTGYKNLEQIANRKLELMNFKPIIMVMTKMPFLKTQRNGSVQLHLRSGLLLRNNFSDCWFLSTGNCIVKYNSAVRQNGTIVINGKTLVDFNEAFDCPFSSQILHAFRGDVKQITRSASEYSCKDVKCKLVPIRSIESHATDFFFIPLLHTFLE